MLPLACSYKLHATVGAAIFPRKYGRSVILEPPYILGNFAAATIFPGDEISSDTGNQLNSLAGQSTKSSPSALPVDFCQGITHGSVRTRVSISSFLHFLISPFPHFPFLILGQPDSIECVPGHGVQENVIEELRRCTIVQCECTSCYAGDRLCPLICLKEVLS